MRLLSRLFTTSPTRFVEFCRVFALVIVLNIVLQAVVGYLRGLGGFRELILGHDYIGTILVSLIVATAVTFVGRR